MKLGIYSISYCGTWYKGEGVDLQSLLRLAKSQGWEGVELHSERPHAATAPKAPVVVQSAAPECLGV